ncbi:MAG: thiamine phosphate synthase [Dehalococcoidia bacterium]
MRIAERRARLSFPALVLVTDSARQPQRETTGEAWLDDIVREAVLGGVSIVQLREKHLERGDLIALGLHIRDAIAGRAMLFVNSNVDAAIALGADGVHLPERALPTGAVRDRVGERMLISRAVHSIDAAVRAERAGADVLQAGTLFATQSKPGAPLLGPNGLSEVCAAVDLPVIAIGGIDAQNAAEALGAGAQGVAVIGAILNADEPREAAAALRRTIDSIGLSGAA